MTEAAALWKLPGPNGFVRAVRRSTSRSQHVAAVLPRKLFEDTDYVETLAMEIEGVRGEIEPLQPGQAATDLVQAIGAGAYLDDPPVTVRTLLTHEEVVGRAFLCVASDLSPEHQSELPEFLRRLEADSRAIPSHQRGTFAFITSHTHLPQFLGSDNSEVGLEILWYWNRVARWDVAALLATQGRDDQGETLLAEIHMETVIEAARWDLDLALQLARLWSGDRAALAEHLSGRTRQVYEPKGPPRREYSSRPPKDVIALWNEGIVDFWHGAITVAPAHRALDSAGIDRLIWNAQARVLLPWVELRRDRLAQLVEQRMGSDRFAAHVKRIREARNDFGSDDVVEIGPLCILIGAVMGKTAPQLTETAHTLRRARNSLAHLTPMTDLEIKALIDKCRWLH